MSLLGMKVMQQGVRFLVDPCLFLPPATETCVKIWFTIVFLWFTGFGGLIAMSRDGGIVDLVEGRLDSSSFCKSFAYVEGWV